MRRGCLVGVWLAVAPFIWLICWLWATSLVDEKALGLGGAGPDAFDFVDMRILVGAFATVMLVLALALAGLTRLTVQNDSGPADEGLDRRRPATADTDDG